MKQLLALIVFISALSGQIFGIELKTGAQDLYPDFFLNEEGEMSGLEIDIMRALEEKVPNLKFAGRDSSEISFVP